MNIKAFYVIIPEDKDAGINETCFDIIGPFYFSDKYDKMIFIRNLKLLFENYSGTKINIIEDRDTDGGGH